MEKSTKIYDYIVILYDKNTSSSKNLLINSHSLMTGRYKEVCGVLDTYMPFLRPLLGQHQQASKLKMSTSYIPINK